MKSKTVRRKEKRYRLQYDCYIKNQNMMYGYIALFDKVFSATKEDYRIYYIACKRSLKYHKRTVIIPKARKVRSAFIDRIYHKSYTIFTEVYHG